MQSYFRFCAMIATSTVVMFVMMYLNSYSFEHVFFSETRAYMALYMGSAMAIIMLLFMLAMYKDKTKNMLILILALVMFIVSLWLVRSQASVADTAWMKSMIPHHSIAILTSERASIEDVRVRKLADEIIQAQRREIAEMQWLIEDIANNASAETAAEAATRPVPNFEATP